MKTSIATVSISGEFDQKLSAIADAGFDAIEIFENDFLAFDRTPGEVGRMVRDRGLVVSLFQPFRDFEGMPDPFRSRNFDRAERKFDLMCELGTDLMLVCSNTSRVSLGGIDRRRPTCASSVSVLPGVVYELVSRPLPGAATSTTTGMPGRLCVVPIIPMLASSSIVSTPCRVR